jgi:signal transduction histidine kinase
MDKNYPNSNHSNPLSLWLVTGVGAFVLVGSLALMGFFQHLTIAEESAALESIGRTNALFLDQSNLPQSRQMAAQLGKVMAAKVELIDPENRSAEQKPDGEARRSGDLLKVGFSLKSGREVWFSRQSSQLGAQPVWKRRDARIALLSFWALALLFSFWLGRKITGPLTKLAAALPSIGTDQQLGALPKNGPREILRLAAALQETHQSLIHEKEKRRHAERLALLGRMATSMAHEVRNPVAAIRLHAQLLARVCENTEKESADLIASEAGRIESLVNQWLRYAKPEPVKMKQVDLAALVTETSKSLSLQAQYAGVEILTEIDPNWSKQAVLGDAERLRQVLCNLLLNAIQSMPTGGIVTLRLFSGVIQIEDQGAGFSEEMLARFGEPFFSEREGGMGLGLAVCHEIIEAHGGEIFAENLAEKGARVSIAWPQKASNQSTADEQDGRR